MVLAEVYTTAQGSYIVSGRVLHRNGQSISGYFGSVPQEHYPGVDSDMHRQYGGPLLSEDSHICDFVALALRENHVLVVMDSALQDTHWILTKKGVQILNRDRDKSGYLAAYKLVSRPLIKVAQTVPSKPTFATPMQ